jgi:hypothetical protein
MAVSRRRHVLYVADRALSLHLNAPPCGVDYVCMIIENEAATDHAYSQPSIESGSLQSAFAVVGGFPRSGVHPTRIPPYSRPGRYSRRRLGPKANCIRNTRPKALNPGPKTQNPSPKL